MFEVSNSANTTPTGFNNVAIHGTAPNTSTGVKGETGTGFGLWGYSPSFGIGVVAESSTGYDFASWGTGVINVNVQTSVGAPANGNFKIGDSIRDANGELWLCTAGGTPGTWVRASHAQARYAGGAINFLPVPIRVIDTRPGMNPAAPLPTTKAPLASGQTYTFQITGTAVGSSSVPAGAVGIYANVTVVFPSGSGNLVFYPADQPQPVSSTINYPKGAVVDNMAFVTLSTASGAAGALKVFVNGPGNTDLVVDIAGFIM